MGYLTEDMAGLENREKTIVRTSFIGILVNVLLAAFKAVVGLITHSIAVTLDAVNNLSDAMSSVITIVGTKLAGKSPDSKHPLGYGRIEYLSAMIVSALVLYAGITSLVESVKSIIHPETPDYSTVSLIIIAAAVIAKVLLGTYVRRTGKRVHSASLEASGSDALFDAIISASVLLCAVLYLLFGLSLESYAGAIISIVIIRSGIGMLRDTLDDILGKRYDEELLSAIRQTVAKDPEVHGVYDLILHAYGPDLNFGSVHVEVRDTMTAPEIDLMERRIASMVFKDHGIVLTSISIYAMNDSTPEMKSIRDTVMGIVKGFDGVLQVHAFSANPEKKILTLDIVLDFAVKDRSALFSQIREAVQQAFPDFTLYLTLDIDF
ncbi:MAG: cation transporter [Clostridia bacterium]|nr:cation transporter [Clostridia bacterium]